MGRHDQAGYLIERGNGYAGQEEDDDHRGGIAQADNVEFGTRLKRFLLYLLGVFVLAAVVVRNANGNGNGNGNWKEPAALRTSAVQVSLASYTYVDGVLSGSINVCAGPVLSCPVLSVCRGQYMHIYIY